MKTWLFLPKNQGYSLTFWVKIGRYENRLIFAKNQGYSLTFWVKVLDMKTGLFCQNSKAKSLTFWMKLINMKKGLNVANKSKPPFFSGNLSKKNSSVQKWICIAFKFLWKLIVIKIGKFLPKMEAYCLNF